ncbi:MAG: beta-galactosidase [Armatimonadota bacterium]
MHKYSVSQSTGGPILMADGKPLSPTMFFVNTDGEATDAAKRLQEIEGARRSGVGIISITSGPFYPASLTAKPDFSETVRRVRMVTAQSPDAKILLRVGVGYPPAWWTNAHPEAVSISQNGKPCAASFFSDVWRKEAMGYLEQMVQTLEAEVGDAMLGYHPCALETGEWFSVGGWEGQVGGYDQPAKAAFRRWLRSKYRTVAALNSAWGSGDVRFADAEPPSAEQLTKPSSELFEIPDQNRQVIDFCEFWNESVADAAILTCQTVKKAAPHRLTALFYGYHYELSGLPLGLRTSGHLALRHMLKAPAVDMLCSPVSYANRLHGGVGQFMSSIDSVQLAGKIWLHEDDTRTHLSADGQYGLPPTANADQTRDVLTRNFGHLISRGSAIWWMDLFGRGWFLGDDVWNPIAKMSDAMRQTYAKTKPYRPEIAVVFDEASAYTQPTGVSRELICASIFREHLYGIGAPLGFYLLDDVLAGKVHWPKMMIFLNAFSMSPAQRAKLRERTRHSTNVWMYASGYVEQARMSAEGISELTGIHVQQMPSQPCSVEMADAQLFDWNNKPVSPGFCIEDRSAESLGSYTEGGKVAIAAKADRSVRDIVCCPLLVPSNIMSNWAKQAGVHLYAKPGDVVAAGKGYVCLTARSAGVKELILPTASALQDVVSGETRPKAKVHSFSMQAGESHLWKLK